MATLQDIFEKVLFEGEAVSIGFDSKKDYDTFRVSLLRKFAGYREQCAAVDISSYDDKFVSCIFDKENGMGTFCLKDKSDSLRVKKQYIVKTL